MGHYRDVITGGTIALLGLGLFAASYGITDFGGGSVGASFLPRVCAILFILLGSLLALQGFRSVAVTGQQTHSGVRTPKERDGRLMVGPSAVLLSLGLMVAYVAVLGWLGFILSSAIYITLQIVVLSRREDLKPLRFVLIAVLCSTISYLLFTKVFLVTIPAGLLG